jgi:palmitoyltransferase
MIISSACATLINPTDRMVYYYKWSVHDQKIAFSPDYDQVLFCLHCDSYCFASSKHCRVCNRCVSNFDHHCMWFNNCVGDRNYRPFFISILSTFAYGLIVIIHAVIESFFVDYGDHSQLVKIIFSWIMAVALVIFDFLLMNLIILHLYLWATNQTTYQFLQRKKREDGLDTNMQIARKIIKEND